MSSHRAFLPLLLVMDSISTGILNAIRFQEGSAIISYETDVPFLSILQVQPREGADKSAYRIVDPRSETTTIPSIEKGDGFDMAGVLVSQGLPFDLFYETQHIGSFVDTPREPTVCHMFLYISCSYISSR